MLAAWKTPHSFALLPVEGDPLVLPPMTAFTYGPLAADLAMLEDPTIEVVTRLGKSLGFEWIASLAEIDRDDDLGDSVLHAQLKSRYALQPGASPNRLAVRRGELVHQRVQPLPSQLLSDFVASERGRLTYIATTTKSLIKPLLAVAAGEPWDVTWQPERAANLLTALAPTIRLRPMQQHDQQRIFVLEAPNLYTRALLEITELYNERPRLAVCARCQRLFVPRRHGEKYCRRYTWPFGGGGAIAGCVLDDAPTADRLELDTAARKREYRRLQMRLVRRATEYGPAHPQTRRARDEFAQWKTSNPARRGRRPNTISLEHIPEVLDDINPPDDAEFGKSRQ
jgi:hypothetical protein